jgi:hypothetical protein
MTTNLIPRPCPCDTYAELEDCVHTDPDWYQTEAYCQCNWDNPGCELCEVDEESEEFDAGDAPEVCACAGDQSCAICEGGDF